MVEKNTTKGGFNATECFLYRENFLEKLKAISDHINLVERNLLETIKQSNKVLEIASNGHKDSLHATLQSIHDTFERGSERFRAQEVRVTELNQDLVTAINDLQTVKLKIQFLLDHKEELKEILELKKEYVRFVELIDVKLEGVSGSISSTNKLVKRSVILVSVLMIAVLVYETTGHDFERIWDLLLTFLSKVL